MGSSEGVLVGFVEGKLVGMLLGAPVGLCDGLELGTLVGEAEGPIDGSELGSWLLDGFSLGAKVTLGAALG